jgi:hypothetical protein
MSIGFSVFDSAWKFTIYRTSEYLSNSFMAFFGLHFRRPHAGKLDRIQPSARPGQLLEQYPRAYWPR